VNTRTNVGILIGSLRKDSLNRKLAKALIAMAPAELKLEIVEIGDLPLFSQDFEADPPQAVREFKRRIEAAGAVLFVTRDRELTPWTNPCIPVHLVRCT
jgi:chromate reductase